MAYREGEVPEEVSGTARLTGLVAGAGLDVQAHSGERQLGADGGDLQTAVERGGLNIVEGLRSGLPGLGHRAMGLLQAASAGPRRVALEMAANRQSIGEREGGA